MYPIKNNNYTVSVPHHPKKVTERATSAKMHNQLSQGWFLENLHFSRLESEHFFLQGVNHNSSKLQGCKDILTVKNIPSLPNYRFR